jgi:hypothetical protein
LRRTPLILIEMREQLEVIEAGMVLAGEGTWSDRSSLALALRDLTTLWWWRDVRHWTSEFHLRGAKRPLSAEGSGRGVRPRLPRTRIV